MRVSPLWLALLALQASSARAAEPFNLSSVCLDAPAPTPASSRAARFIASPTGTMILLDQGFCAAYRESLLLDPPSVWSKPIPALAELGGAAGGPEPFQPKPRWRVRAYMSHSFTSYMPTDVIFRSTRYDLTIKDYHWAERGSRNFFEPMTWQKPGNNPLQIFDEPTNTFVLSIEKNGHEFFLSAFHPKFLQAVGQVREMHGTIDGVAVSGWQTVDQNVPTGGESAIARNENTYREMIFELGYGRRVKLVSGKLGSIVFVPSLGLGLATGNNYASVVPNGEQSVYDDKSERYGVQGFGGSVAGRVELNGRRERVGVFYEHKLAWYKMKHGFLDGTQQYDLRLSGHSVGLKFMIHDQGRRRKKPPVEY